MITKRAGSQAGTVGIPAELQSGVPRDVTLTAGGVTVLVVAVVLAVGAVVAAILTSIAYLKTEDDRQLRSRETIVTEAQVTNVTLRRGDHPRRIITYDYEADGRRYSGQGSLPLRDRPDIAEGTAVTVGYVRSRPAASWMLGYEPGGFPVVLIPILPAALLMGAAAIALGLRRQRVLLSEGRPALARVTGSKKVQRSHHHVNRVEVEFQTLSGATRTASYESSKTAPPPGTIVTIVYHRDQPNWTARYPMQLVRPARHSSTIS